jgi:hypothetical protein
VQKKRSSEAPREVRAPESTEMPMWPTE